MTPPVEYEALRELARSYFDDPLAEVLAAAVAVGLGMAGVESWSVADGAVIVRGGPKITEDVVGMHLGLDNLALVCSRSDPSRWLEVAVSHFTALLGTLCAPRGDLASVAGRLLPRLLAEDVALAHGIPHETPVRGLALCVAVDAPDAVTFVDDDHLSAWATSFSSVLAAAWRNFYNEGWRSHVESSVMDEDYGAVLVTDDRGGYGSVHVLHLDQLVSGWVHGPVEQALVACPSRGACVVLPTHDGVATTDVIGDLLAWTRDTYAEMPQRLSDNLFWWDGRGLVALDCDANGRITNMPRALRVVTSPAGDRGPN